MEIQSTKLVTHRFLATTQYIYLDILYRQDTFGVERSDNFQIC